ncbi:hypothetical protein PHMEG_00016999 [Phytophthora megakarya]|uniref:Uncharacterized protein n=1 Tax=Phytophthora megakarya TaxID=4795 RepID=A0A225W000_9STRA|nr:hypothetical protein PHMEG_00016999 [Phytophthora megakarya]
MFVTSQRKQLEYSTMLALLKQIYNQVTEKVLGVRYVMGYADEAQMNALHDCTSTENHCHQEKMALAAADVFDMHYALSKSQVHARKTLAVR